MKAELKGASPGAAAAPTAAEGAPTAAEALAAAEAAALASRSELEALLPPPPAGASVEQRLRYEIALLLAEEGELREPESFELDDALVAFGLDSLRLTMLKGAIERELGAEVPDEELYDEQTTLRDLIETVEAGGGGGGGEEDGAPAAAGGAAADAAPSGSAAAAAAPPKASSTVAPAPATGASAVTPTAARAPSPLVDGKCCIVS